MNPQKASCISVLTQVMPIHCLCLMHGHVSSAVCNFRHEPTLIVMTSCMV